MSREYKNGPNSSIQWADGVNPEDWRNMPDPDGDRDIALENDADVPTPQYVIDVLGFDPDELTANHAKHDQKSHGNRKYDHRKGKAGLKRVAKAVIDISWKDREVSVDRIVEIIDDEYEEFRSFKYSTMTDMIRSAARDLGRLSEDGEKILAEPTANHLPGQHDQKTHGHRGYETGHTQTMRGEFWIQGGQAVSADGDIGDLNHEGHASQAAAQEVADALKNLDVEDLPGFKDLDPADAKLITDAIDQIDEYSEWVDPSDALWQIESELDIMDTEELAKHLGLEEDPLVIDVSRSIGNTDPRIWAAKKHNWVRLAGNDLQMVGISRGKMQRMADGLYDAYGDDVEKESFNLEVIDWNSVGENIIDSKVYDDVPFQVLEGGNMGDLRQFVRNEHLVENHILELNHTPGGKQHDQKSHGKKKGGSSVTYKNIDDEGSAEEYFSIGHGDDGSMYEVFIIEGGHIDGSGLIDPEEDSTTHGRLFGHDRADKAFKGRYDDGTDKVSIVVPDRLRNRDLPSYVIRRLENHFHDDIDIVVFNERDVDLAILKLNEEPHVPFVSNHKPGGKEHDQSTHGNWAKKIREEIRLMKEELEGMPDTRTFLEYKKHQRAHIKRKEKLLREGKEPPKKKQQKVTMKREYSIEEASKLSVDDLKGARRIPGTYSRHGSEPGRVLHGMVVNDVEVSWEKGLEKQAHETLSNIKEVHPKLWEQNEYLTLVKNRNINDEELSKDYGFEINSIATGGDGGIVVYQGQAAQRNTIAHESAHNLAGNEFGDVFPPTTYKNWKGEVVADFSDRKIEMEGSFKRVANAVTKYGRSTTAEDFAEFVTAYNGVVHNKDFMVRGVTIDRLKTRPKTFESVERLLGGE